MKLFLVFPENIPGRDTVTRTDKEATSDTLFRI